MAGIYVGEHQECLTLGRPTKAVILCKGMLPVAMWGAGNDSVWPKGRQGTDPCPPHLSTLTCSFCLLSSAYGEYTVETEQPWCVLGVVFSSSCPGLISLGCPWGDESTGSHCLLQEHEEVRSLSSIVAEEPSVDLEIRRCYQGLHFKIKAVSSGWKLPWSAASALTQSALAGLCGTAGVPCAWVQQHLHPSLP